MNISFPVDMLKVKPRYSSFRIREKGMNKMGRERLSKEVTFAQRLEK